MTSVAELRARGARIPKKDLSKFMLPIRNQTPFGACGAFAMASIFEFYLYRRDGKVFKSLDTA